MQPACSRELDRPESQPYFVWDEPIRVAELRARLRQGDGEERLRWAARILRDARFDDVWRFLTVEDVVRLWPALAPRLGRRRAFWTWMLDRWRAHGLIA
jgi:hypothetical protein